MSGSAHEYERNNVGYFCEMRFTASRFFGADQIGVNL